MGAVPKKEHKLTSLRRLRELAFRGVKKPFPLSLSPTHLDGLPLLVALLPALDEDVEAEDEQHARHQRDGHRDDAQPPRR